MNKNQTQFTKLDNETSISTPNKQNQTEITSITSRINSNIENISTLQEHPNPPEKIIPTNYTFSTPIKTNSNDNNVFVSVKSFPKKRSKRFIFKLHGNLLLIFCSDKLTEYNEPIIVIGPHWYVFLLGIILLVLSELLLYYLLWQKSSQLFCIIGAMINIVHMIVYIWLFISNPGVVIRNAKEGEIACPHCKCVRNKECKQKHCKECDACFEGLDHHCPWVSKCVGVKNVSLFRSFLVLTMFVLFWFIVTLVTYE